MSRGKRVVRASAMNSARKTVPNTSIKRKKAYANFARENRLFFPILARCELLFRNGFSLSVSDTLSIPRTSDRIVISVETHSVITRRHGLTILESRSLLQKSVSTNGAADNDQRTDHKDDEDHWHEPPFFVLHQEGNEIFPKTGIFFAVASAYSLVITIKTLHVEEIH
jgi:hypothetical protein